MQPTSKILTISKGRMMPFKLKVSEPKLQILINFSLVLFFYFMILSPLIGESQINGCA